MKVNLVNKLQPIKEFSNINYTKTIKLDHSSFTYNISNLPKKIIDDLYIEKLVQQLFYLIFTNEKIFLERKKIFKHKQYQGIRIRFIYHFYDSRSESPIKITKTIQSFNSFIILDSKQIDQKFEEFLEQYKNKTIDFFNSYIFLNQIKSPEDFIIQSIDSYVTFEETLNTEHNNKMLYFGDYLDKL